MFSNHPTVRGVIYGLAIAAQIAAVFIRISKPELADAFDSAANILAVYAGAQAITNLNNVEYVPVTVSGDEVGRHVRANGLDG